MRLKTFKSAKNLHSTHLCRGYAEVPVLRWLRRTIPYAEVRGPGFLGRVTRMGGGGWGGAVWGLDAGGGVGWQGRNA